MFLKDKGCVWSTNTEDVSTSVHRSDNKPRIQNMKRSETTGFTEHHKHKHQASFPITHQQSACPVFMLLEVLRLSSQRRCVIDRAAEQAMTQFGGMIAHAAHSHMHTCLEAEAKQSGSYQHRRTSADYRVRKINLSKPFRTVSFFFFDWPYWSVNG